MRIDSMTVEQARNADIITFLESRCCYTFKQHLSAYRCVQHPSLAVKGDRRTWYWHSKSIGGFGSIDYMIKIEHVPFRAAVRIILSSSTGKLTPISMRTAPEAQPKTLILPEKSGTFLRLWDYLCRRRGISSEIVRALIQEGKIYEDNRGNVVFIGFDECGTPRFASVRGTSSNRIFRIDCRGSDKRYSFQMTYSLSETLYIYESAIDAMSAASIDIALSSNTNVWKRYNRLSLSGTSDIAIPKYLQMYPNTKELVFCLDNDPPGREAASSLAMKYADQGHRTRILLPTRKDYNEILVYD
jgi:hypothetical protein